MNPYREIDDVSLSASATFDYEDIATQLLKDNYFLTALELHTELLENGKELPQLRDFFSNPGNFEQNVAKTPEFNTMDRCPSIATLDSLDAARYSEDGGGDQASCGADLAVLEFELRKARETINALRANLTQFADGDIVFEKPSIQSGESYSLKPHEKRALNFLINEYLLLEKYKLTSITFSDENPEQDFESWDDVGLNIPKPCGLVSFFCKNLSKSNYHAADAWTQTDKHTTTTGCQTESCDSNLSGPNDVGGHEYIIGSKEIELLKHKVSELETEKLNFQRLYDAAIVSLNSIMTPASETKSLHLEIPQDRLLMANTKREESLEAKPLTVMASENYYGSGTSNHSGTTDRFEVIDNENNCENLKKGSSNTSSFDPMVLCDAHDSPLRRASVATLDETPSFNDAAEWTRVHYQYNTVDGCKEVWLDSQIPENLKQFLLSWCSEPLKLNESTPNELFLELLSSEKPMTLDGLLSLLADTLPKVVSQLACSRRAEAAALIAAVAALLPAGDARRSRLVTYLLTLLKRPEKMEATLIAQATKLIVKWGGAGEVLSSIAELLASRSSERKILASQVCVSVAPHVPLDLCTSLLFSIVTMMCESSEIEVRSSGLRVACLVCPVAENKYDQLENVAFNFLKDPVESNHADCVRCLLPVIARSALISEKFSSSLMCRIIKNLHKACDDNEWKSVLMYINLFKVLMLAQLAYVLNVQIVREVTLRNCNMETISLHKAPLNVDAEHLMDLQSYVIGFGDAKSLVTSMNSLLNEEPEMRWTELHWLVDILKQILDIAASSNAISHPSLYDAFISLFDSYIENFGDAFAVKILNPIFLHNIVDLEQKMEKLHAFNNDRVVIVGVYLVTVLPVLHNSSHHSEFLQKWIMYSSIRGVPSKVFSTPFKWSAKHKPQHLELLICQLQQFASCSRESASGSSVRAYIAGLMAEVVDACDVTEACLGERLLPLANQLLYDDNPLVREVAVGLWGSVTRACVSRCYSSQAQCWAPIERWLGGAQPLSAKETARIAEALALLILPAADNEMLVCEKGVEMVCGLCARAASGEAVCALTPGLQLAARHAPRHPALLPALRIMDEKVQAPSLSQYKPAIEALIQNVTGAPPADSAKDMARATSNLNTAQEMGRRMTQMFQQSKSNMTLHNIFKKKT